MANLFGLFVGLSLSNPSSGAIPAIGCEISAAITDNLLGSVTLCVVGAQSLIDAESCLTNVPSHCPWSNCWLSYTQSVYQAGVQNSNACNSEVYSDACMVLVGSSVGTLETCMGFVLVPPRLPVSGSCTLREAEVMLSRKESSTTDPIDDFLSKKLSIDSSLVSGNCAACYSSFVSNVGSIIQSQQAACGDLTNNRDACFREISIRGTFVQFNQCVGYKVMGTLVPAGLPQDIDPLPPRDQTTTPLPGQGTQDDEIVVPDSPPPIISIPSAGQTTSLPNQGSNSQDNQVIVPGSPPPIISIPSAGQTTFLPNQGSNPQDNQVFVPGSPPPIISMPPNDQTTTLLPGKGGDPQGDQGVVPDASAPCYVQPSVIKDVIRCSTAPDGNCSNVVSNTMPCYQCILNFRSALLNPRNFLARDCAASQDSDECVTALAQTGVSAALNSCLGIVPPTTGSPMSEGPYTTRVCTSAPDTINQAVMCGLSASCDGANVLKNVECSSCVMQIYGMVRSKSAVLASSCPEDALYSSQTCQDALQINGGILDRINECLSGAPAMGEVQSTRASSFSEVSNTNGVPGGACVPTAASINQAIMCGLTATCDGANALMNIECSGCVMQLYGMVQSNTVLLASSCAGDSPYTSQTCRDSLKQIGGIVDLFNGCLSVNVVRTTGAPGTGGPCVPSPDSVNQAVLCALTPNCDVNTVLQNVNCSNCVVQLYGMVQSKSESLIPNCTGVSGFASQACQDSLKQNGNIVDQFNSCLRGGNSNGGADCGLNGVFGSNLINGVTACAVSGQSASICSGLVQESYGTCGWSSCWNTYVSTITSSQGPYELSVCDDGLTRECVNTLSAPIATLGNCMGASLIPDSRATPGNCTLQESIYIYGRFQGGLEPPKDYFQNALSINSTNVGSIHCVDCYSSLISGIGKFISTFPACSNMTSDPTSCQKALIHSSGLIEQYNSCVGFNVIVLSADDDSSNGGTPTVDGACTGSTVALNQAITCALRPDCDVSLFANVSCAHCISQLFGSVRANVSQLSSACGGDAPSNSTSCVNALQQNKLLDQYTSCISGTSAGGDNGSGSGGGGCSGASAFVTQAISCALTATCNMTMYQNFPCGGDCLVKLYTAVQSKSNLFFDACAGDRVNTTDCSSALQRNGNILDDFNMCIGNNSGNTSASCSVSADIVNQAVVCGLSSSCSPSLLQNYPCSGCLGSLYTMVRLGNDTLQSVCAGTLASTSECSNALQQTGVWTQFSMCLNANSSGIINGGVCTPQVDSVTEAIACGFSGSATCNATASFPNSQCKNCLIQLSNLVEANRNETVKSQCERGISAGYSNCSQALKDVGIMDQFNNCLTGSSDYNNNTSGGDECSPRNALKSNLLANVTQCVASGGSAPSCFEPILSVIPSRCSASTCWSAYIIALTSSQGPSYQQCANGLSQQCVTALKDQISTLGNCMGVSLIPTPSQAGTAGRCSFTDAMRIYGAFETDLDPTKDYFRGTLSINATTVSSTECSDCYSQLIQAIGSFIQTSPLCKDLANIPSACIQALQSSAGPVVDQFNGCVGYNVVVLDGQSSNGGGNGNRCDLESFIMNDPLSTMTNCVAMAQDASPAANCLSTIPSECSWSRCFSDYITSIYGVNDIAAVCNDLGNAPMALYKNTNCMQAISASVATLANCAGYDFFPRGTGPSGQCSLSDAVTLQSAFRSWLDPPKDYFSGTLSLNRTVVSSDSCVGCYSQLITNIGAIVETSPDCVNVESNPQPCMDSLIISGIPDQYNNCVGYVVLEPKTSSNSTAPTTGPSSTTNMTTSSPSTPTKAPTTPPKESTVPPTTPTKAATAASTTSTKAPTTAPITQSKAATTAPTAASTTSTKAATTTTKTTTTTAKATTTATTTKPTTTTSTTTTTKPTTTKPTTTTTTTTTTKPTTTTTSTTTTKPTTTKPTTTTTTTTTTKPTTTTTTSTTTTKPTTTKPTTTTTTTTTTKPTTTKPTTSTTTTAKATTTATTIKPTTTKTTTTTTKPTTTKPTTSTTTTAKATTTATTTKPTTRTTTTAKATTTATTIKPTTRTTTTAKATTTPPKSTSTTKRAGR